MDDGELEFSNHEVFSSPNMGDQLPSSCSMDSFFEEILKDTHACTHTHTCNPPGPDFTHTHTCFHVHTKILSGPGSEDKHTTTTDDTAESTEKTSKKRPLGNREAVRKYREKKKARAASLEDEVVRLRALNQQLMKRLQGQAVLEAEIARLKCLLVDIRGRIEGEIGCFPYKLGKGGDGGVMSSLQPQPNLSSGYVLNSCDLRCDDQLSCLHPSVDGGGVSEPGFGVCDVGNVHCSGGTVNLGMKEFSGCGNVNVGGAGIPSINKRKGARTATEP